MSNYQDIPLKHVKPHPLNPRREFDEASLRSLADSMVEVGLLEPIIVRKLKHSRGTFELIAGERRLRAAALANWTSIPAIVRDVSDAEALTMQLVENLQRVDLNPIELGRGLNQLCLPEDEGGAGKSREEAGKLFDHSHKWVASHIRVLEMPQAWQDRIAAGEIPQGKFYALLPYVEKPVVLAKIEADMAENPWAYRTTLDFVESVKRIAAEDGGTGIARNRALADAPTQRLPQSGAAKARLQIASPEEDTAIEEAAAGCARVESVIAAIAAIDDAGDLERILFAVQERIEAVAAHANETEAATS